MKTFCLITDALYKILLAFCAFALSTMVVVISAQVFCRFFLDFTPYWSEELSLIIMIYCGFLGAALAYKKGLHIRLEFVIRSFGPRAQKKISLLIDFVLLGFSICTVYYGYQLTEKTIDQVNPALGWPVACSYGVIPVSGAIFLLFAAEKTLNGLSKVRTEES